MNKQKVLAIALVALLGVLAIGGTSAYFTYSERARNAITTSGIAIRLIEDTDEIGVDGRAVPFRNVDGVMPGDKISKIPKVVNIDEGDAFIRIKATVSATMANNSQITIPVSVLSLDINTAKWTQDGDYYYYNDILSANQTTEPLFTTVAIPENLSEQYQNTTFSLDINAEAVQVANNGATALEAQGWPEE